MYTIIKDTRERDGWTFEPYQKCKGMIDHVLKTGDYSIVGMEEIVCIERKASSSEIAINVGSDRVRFYKELERMRAIPHKFIICEFSCSDLLRFPDGAGIPKNKLPMIKMTGRTIMKFLIEIQMEYNVQILFCDNPSNAFTTAFSILKRVYEKYG